MTSQTDIIETTGAASAKEEYAPEEAPRLPLAERVPEFYRAMLHLERATAKDIDPTLYHLIKIRASQINHCAFCIDMHTKDALAEGETVERIVQLSAWGESRHFYTEKELAALELTESVTLLTDGPVPVPDEVYARAAAHFDETEIARVISAIVVINAWNRIAISTRMTPGHYTPRSA
ncbi:MULTISPECIES: carboxymuconolactone decarboxylase family protein [unclassified Streptomyces]|uniref:carboxymuconolactone decarboxylase family protein n=1 Tax=unclassified Streptomyces TaxID=2593676 RepID=UPI0016614381|nr:MULTISPECIES: carboxymuconolactone decarboxylase family protein [unclassified Streptomyces]MBD0710962.1 alkylhydroperoxidase [Streptomyces sp. CBMA291]MBD0717497.1 alkylhydroperoxidase [Streptomyces sp. CBMA370]